ncbi:LEAF RUST 10 DISEASE-RESISTANCE LOCUS RECEPTOR-LIKE PROTEIN KINASE-like 1.1 isoform X4 [Humulus lupulus]|uniref:LEAF RUST 10 DISEASE-RESISTANCE LOCUS RECEPTOR-LIKE PROTEIN KINASE-like 1.1 isoform X4 n=1 Tax=Humulus lupulus TaxID=3486 RepID=UPI002B4177B7|nr:LEAF RUST 10 DISEASE-RESISTANCE LOCUS RECEPTOR-LIKE PROTEIN KINASE-like 1.1 isoform X4 [Humulus lupulus]
MYPLLHASSLIFFTIVTVSVGVPTPYKTVEDEAKFEACSRLFKCGYASFGYPYWGGERNQDCGRPGFKLECHHNTYPEIEILSRKFYILGERDETITVVDADMVDDGCPDRVVNISAKALENSPFKCASNNARLTYVYNCSTGIPNTTLPELRCTSKAEPGYYLMDPSGYEKLLCNGTISIPLLQKYYTDLQINRLTAKDALSKGFDLEYRAEYGQGACWECLEYSGQCGFNTTSEEFVCFSKSSNSGLSKQQKLGLGLGIGFVVLFAMMGLAIIMWCRKQKRAASRNIDDPNMNMNMEDPEGASGYLGVLVFSYKELTEATNNFDADRELGDGGFGTVYHGKLKDGREVAVKRLYEHNYKRLEQFINEIQILAGLRHKNLVSLYGCTSRRSRELLLVYEYIPNGTVADHLHGDRAKTSPLTWPIRLSVAIETARALAYLHASDIVHRDVKTNNILLDNNFCVKVADFGLSRLFPSDVTHVSTAPQGTPGYVDPEYHQCYQLTSKSDVYSFGVVLVELLSSMPAVDITRHRHEINLSNLAISKIQKQAYNELIDQDLGFDSDTRVRTMTIAVAELAFECLQQDKEMRPTMDEVLERLMRIEDGKIETKVVGGSELSMSTVLPPPPSPECDEIGLLKNIKQEQPPSPNAVTENWLSSTSTTPNFSG